MNEDQRAAYMFMYHYNACGVEHFRRLAIGVSVEAPVQLRTPPISGPRARNLHIGGAPVAADIRMVASLIQEDSVVWEVVKRSPDSMEYEVAGTMLWLSSLAPELLMELARAGWLEVPLPMWHIELKKMLELPRRAGIFGGIVGDQVYQLRKMANVTWRRDEEADWAQEKYNRTSRSCGKHLLSGGSYLHKLFEVECAYEDKHCALIADRVDTSPMEEWWARRGHHVPGGSTSSGYWIRDILKSDERFGKDDRPGKKSVMEALPQEGFMNWLFAQVPSLTARASTKYEPGGKQRALYAANDIPYLLSAYASVHAEKEKVHRGVVARQSPEDALLWMQDCMEIGGYWLSTDYSDYNAEHTLAELALGNLARAQAWAKIPGEVARTKAASSVWMAQAVMSSYVQWPGGDMQRVFSGLFSGGRDTMRDHCTKHDADIKIGRFDAQMLGYAVEMAHPQRGEYLAGDDEDVCFATALDAGIYATTLCMQGHDLNPSKQMAGSKHHEFLLLIAHPDSSAHRPLAALLATLASGDWYVPTATWYDAAISSLSDSWWEAACRGLPATSARRMASAYLDTLMRVPEPARTMVDGGHAGRPEWKKLEWWSYRSANRKHPLWNVVTEGPPVVRDKPTPHRSWPSKATDAWMELHAKQLRHVPARKRRLYRDALLEASHGSAFLKYRQTSLREKVGENWPRRVERTYDYGGIAIAAPYSMADMAQMAYSLIGQNSRPRTEEELASRLGVDSQMLTLLGGFWEIPKFVDARRWAKFAQILPARGLSERCHTSSWTFRSLASRSVGLDPRLHDGVVDPAPLCCYVYVPNGGGKTWMVSRFGGLVDLDTVAAPVSALRPRARRGLENHTARQFFLTRLLLRAQATGARALLGQIPIAEVAVAAEAIHLKMRMLSYEPGVAVRVERLRDRGWDVEKIERYASRWVYYPDSCQTVQELVDALAAVGLAMPSSGTAHTRRENIKQ